MDILKVLNPAKMSVDDFKTYAVDKIQTILNEQFTDPNKRKIKILKDSINFACPICGDSSTDPNKKRAHIILNGKFAGKFKCFNCNQYMTAQHFFRSYKINITDQAVNLLRTIATTPAQDNSRSSQTAFLANLMYNEPVYELAIPRDKFKSFYGLYELTDKVSYEGALYLINRMQNPADQRFLYSPRYRQIYLLNLINDRILGAQTRKLILKPGESKYWTKSIEKIREEVMCDNTPIPDNISKMSMLFNIFRIDYSDVNKNPIIVTEGPFDAFLLPNAIATAGASKNLKFKLPVRYLYDSDKTGTTHAVEKLNSGYYVFKWPQFIKDYNLPKRDKWDVTDVICYLKGMPYWNNYFTNNQLDMFML